MIQCPAKRIGESRQSAGFAPERIRASIYKTKPIFNRKERSSQAREQVFWLARQAGGRLIRPWEALPRALQSVTRSRGLHISKEIPMPSFRMRSLGALPIRTQ
jgi:hypothetical protein